MHGINYHRLEELFKRYLNDSATPAEVAELMALAEDPAYSAVLQQVIGDAFAAHAGVSPVADQRAEAILDHIFAQQEAYAAPAKSRFLWPGMAAAAVIILSFSIGIYNYLHRQPAPQSITQIQTHDLAPGSNKAILTLGSGKKIILADVSNGTIADQEGVTVHKKANGQLSYEAVNAGHKNTAMVYDTLTIPPAGCYHLTLSDGTKMWLNAATQVRYPERFAGNERRIELISGEVYVEVVHNAAIPFRVVTHQQTVEDIGTHFNINAYDDEPAIKTTLLEGSIKVTSGTASRIIKPGQQLALKQNHLTVDEVDTDEVIAWKNGYFQFDDEPLESIMRKISRWYDVKVDYQDNEMKAMTFNGTISKYKNVSQVLKKLELTGTVNFKLTGNKIIGTRQ
jgi:transmembrane sensor